jgi:hypothetical protein
MIVKVLTANGNQHQIEVTQADMDQYKKDVRDPNVQQVFLGNSSFNKHTIVELVQVDETKQAQ